MLQPEWGASRCLAELHMRPGLAYVLVLGAVTSGARCLSARRFSLRLANSHSSSPPKLRIYPSPRCHPTPDYSAVSCPAARLPCCCPAHLLPAPPPVANMTRPRKDVKFQHAARSASNGRARRLSQSISEMSEGDSQPASPTKNGAVAPPVRWPLPPLLPPAIR